VPRPDATHIMNTDKTIFVREAIFRAIASGRWRPGVPIPNENELAKEFGVAVRVIRETLRALQRELVLVRADSVRQGHRATEPKRQPPGTAAVERQVVLAHIGEYVARTQECLRLELAPKSKVYRIERVLWHRGRPSSFERVTVPADLCPGLPQRQCAAERVTLLARSYGLKLGEAKEHASTSVANEQCATKLGIGVGTLIRVLDRVIFEASGRALEWRLAYCAPS